MFSSSQWQNKKTAPYVDSLFVLGGSRKFAFYYWLEKKAYSQAVIPYKRRIERLEGIRSIPCRD